MRRHVPPLRGQLPVNGRRFRLTEVAGLSDNAGMNDTAKLLQTVEHETGPTPEWTVLWLHGLGADGHDFAPIVPELVRRNWPALRFVFPHAPVRPVTINNGMSMRAWYDIVSLEPGRIADRADEAGVRESIAQVEALIEREQGRGIAADRIVLAGFSQGCAMALLTGLRHPGSSAKSRWRAWSGCPPTCRCRPRRWPRSSNRCRRRRAANRCSWRTGCRIRWCPTPVAR